MIRVLLPSRGRPHRIPEVYKSFIETATLKSTKLTILLNQDDPTIDDYLKNMPVFSRTMDARFDTLTKKLNEGAFWYYFRSEILGFVADDNIFRTKGWDEKITEALSRPGIAYGNDLYQGEGLPTSVFISTEIVRALGWFALPACDHMYLDNAWKILGERLGRLVYLPDVVIEHMHPVVGKGGWDETYSLSNTSERLSKDREAFENWLAHGVNIDVRKVNEALRL